jgi:hypothetical protein
MNLWSKSFRTDLLFCAAFLGALLLYYPELLLARSASLMGDHWEQHFPWAFTMAQSLRHGVSPFWTPLIQCGFPIMAESQMGLFYPPNLALYLLLPFQWGYAYLNLVHFLISGLGTYAYGRAIGMSPAGAFTAAVVFVFGTGYGGAYYNITSLKTLAWMPWILWMFEKCARHFRFRYLLAMSAVMAMALLAGYLQVAALMLMICFVYFLLRLCAFPPEGQTGREKLALMAGTVLAGAGAVILSFPQWLLTLELAMHSNRIELSEDYAYVGSLLPPALLTFIFPNLQGLFRGNCFYSGIFSIYFVTAVFFGSGKNFRRLLWLWTAMTLIALFLALGQWSPLYVGLIKLTRFYSFRVPAKFLIFVCFGFAVLAGMGVHVWREELVRAKERLAALNRTYLRVLAGIMGIWAAAYFALTAGRAYVIGFGERLVELFIYGKSGRPRSLEAYFEAVTQFTDMARDMLAVTDPWKIWALILIAISGVWIFATGRYVNKRRGPALLLTVAIGVLLVDLYVFSWEDIKRDFDSYQNVFRPNAVAEKLLEEKQAGRMGRLYDFRREAETLPLVPSVNMLYGIEDIGGYAPLIMGRYFETIGQLGNVNDSNTQAEPDLGFVLERLPLLRALDVSHVQSMQAIDHPDFELLIRDKSTGARLYRLRGERSRGHFIGGRVEFGGWPEIRRALMAPGFDPGKVLWLEDDEKPPRPDSAVVADSTAERIERVGHENDRESWKIKTTGPGFFVTASVMYPGWEARIDGRKVPVFRAHGLFRAVWIPRAGEHTVDFRYRPYRLSWPAFGDNKTGRAD